MAILVGLLPALLWGIGPIIATKAGGRPVDQLMGTVYGQIIVGLVLYIIFRPTLTLSGFIWCFAGGALWSIAQLMQFDAFTKMNVSTAMPISTGLQLVEIPLIGVIVWGEWGSVSSKLIGFISILVLIIGITFTSIQDSSVERPKMNYKSGLMLLIVGSLGYTACSVFPRVPNASGLSSLFPQTLGMFFGGVVIGLILQRRDHQPLFFTKPALKSISIGITGGFGVLAYLSSLKLNGVATAFPLTQLNVIISTLGGIIVLKEKKNQRELILTIIGLILVIGSAFMISRLD
ncbi:GRP family sugar transporter [Nicoliella spurrieriana]|uniref:GRP family sugar transporter n=1 Tax=Nicoliella spurrieriana TaxID=2925830 RepID=A0A976RT21_9LACO|nr:GRP family sugar transporter [Nicoliella spurrieriana]UQS87214.1 GRP family sugar transporter [Nicoliella spurrieriana]